MFAFEVLEIVVIVFALSWFMKTYLIQFHLVNDQTMTPTLEKRSAVVADLFFYNHGSALKSKNLILCRDPEGDTVVRRVLARAGDTVETRNGVTFVNTRSVYEPYLKSGYGIRTENIALLTVPENHIYLLNDNRHEREDSRTWGCIPLEQVVGRVVFCYWPWTSWGFFL